MITTYHLTDLTRAMQSALEDHEETDHLRDMLTEANKAMHSTPPDHPLGTLACDMMELAMVILD